MNRIILLSSLLLLCLILPAQNTIRLDQLDISNGTVGWGNNQKNLSIQSNPLKIAGVSYTNGVGTHGYSEFNLYLYGTTTRFQAKVGVDDEINGGSANLEFKVIGDGNTLFSSGIMGFNTPAKTIDLNTTGISVLKLIVTLGSDNVNSYDHADWCNAVFTYSGLSPITKPLLPTKSNGDYYPLYPFVKDFSKTLVTKFLFDSGDGITPVPSVDAALNFMQEVDQLTRGVPKIMSLVGWQLKGHDHQYPQWGPINPKLKRPQDNNAIESLNYLFNTASSLYHTEASIHVNWVDGYADCPMWGYYVKNDLICKNSDGSLVKTWYDSKNNRQGYAMNLKKLWDIGRLQQQIDSMVLQFPQLIKGSILTDANIYVGSPYHNVSSDDQKVAYARAINYAKQKYGLTIYGEYGAEKDANLYAISPVSTIWWGANPMAIPPYIACAGNDHDIIKKEVQIFGGSIQLEELGTNSSQVLQKFAHYTVPYFFLNTKLRISYDEARSTAYFSDGVKSFIYSSTIGTKYPNGALVITQNDNDVRINDDMFVPLVWRPNLEIFAFSLNGLTKTWTFPSTWDYVSAVDIYNLTKTGLTSLQKNVSISNHQLTVSLAAKQAKIIVPAGTLVDKDLNEPKPTLAKVNYLGSNQLISGNWKNVIGKDGYDIVGLTTNSIPSYAKVAYIGTTDLVWSNNTSDSRALQLPTSMTDRIAGSKQCQLHEIIDIEIMGGEAKKISLYMLDWENLERQTLIEIIDANSGNILHGQIIKGYQNGQYLQYSINGHVQIRLTRFLNENMQNVGNPSFSGVFFDAAEATNVNKITSSDNVKLYPNPSREKLFVESKSGIKNIQIFSINSVCVKNISISYPQFRTPIDISDLAEGVYQSVIETADGKLALKFTKK